MNDDRVFDWQASVGKAQLQQQGVANRANRSTKSAALLPQPAAANGGSTWAQKSVLLVDANRQTRQSRAKIMRTMGVRVECVANADTARAKLAAEKYNLILVDLGHDVTGAESLVGEIRSRNSRQLVGFLVGSPLFVSQSLNGKPSRPMPLSVVPTGARVAEVKGAASEFGQKTGNAETDAEKLA